MRQSSSSFAAEVICFSAREVLALTKPVMDITGLRSGRLTAAERTKEKRNNNVLWRCRCDCGREVLLPAYVLRAGSVKSCGCLPRGRHALELTGRRFGRLTALRRTEEKSGTGYLWLCRCDCGKELLVRANALTSGNTRSCGCARDEARKARARDIAGQRFGMLTAVVPTGKSRRGSVEWRCQCDCGREAACTYNELVYCSVRSCGCAQHPSRALPLHYIDGTCVELLEQKTLRRDNTSGYTGVVRTRYGWRAQIIFKKTNYYLGTFQNLEEAAQARKQAEANLHGAFLEWYEREAAARRRSPGGDDPAAPDPPEEDPVST